MILYEVPTDQRARDRKESFVNEIQSFVAHFQSPELMQPCDRSLDNPARLTEAAAVGGASLGQHRADTLVPKSATMGGRVVSAVSLHTVRTSAGAPASTTQGRYSLDQGQQLRYIMGIGRREYRCERDAPSIRDEVMLAAGFAPVGRVWTCFFPRASRARTSCRLSYATTRFSLPPAGG